MAALQYLTVQDVLWINLQVTGTPQEFDYANLEEATFYQYGYGQSASLIPQAANFLRGFLKKKPFAAGNEQTAFVACLSFLKANGVDVVLDDPLGWLAAVNNGTHDAQQAIEKFAHESHSEHHGMPEVRDAITAVLGIHTESIGSKDSVSV